MNNEVEKNDSLRRKELRTFVRPFLWYSIFFFVFCAVAFAPFFFDRKLFVWGVDGIGQHYPNILYTKQWIKKLLYGILDGKLRFIQWEMTQGLGGDIFGNAFSYRIINAFCVFFRGDSVELFFYFRAIVNLFLSGISFLFYARTKSKDTFALLVGSLTYTFSAYAIFFSPRHAFFIEMMVFFPMLCLSVDQLFEKGKSFLLTLTVFLAAVSYIYFLFIVSLGAVVYGVFAFFAQNKTEQTFKRFLYLFLRATLYYGLGVLMAAFSILPSVLTILGNSRSASSQGENLLLWDKTYYLNYLTGQLSAKEIGLYGFISLNSVSVLALVNLIGSKEKDDKVVIGQIAFYNAVFLIPLFVLAFSGFAGKTERWCFILQFWLSISAVIGVDRLKKNGFRLTAPKVVFILILFAGYLSGTILTDQSISYSFFFSALVVICAAILLKKERRHTAMIIFSAVLFLVTLAETKEKSDTIFNGNNKKYISQFVSAGTLQKAGDDSLAADLNSYEEESYRVDAVQQRGAFSGTELNYGLRSNVKGLSSYYSLAGSDFIDFSFGLGNADLNTSILVSGLDQRTVLDTICSVKYLATTGAYHVPNSYNLINTYSRETYNGNNLEVEIYENENALPLVFAYDSYIPREEYDSLSPSKKEQALIQGVVLDGTSDLNQTELQFDAVSLISQKMLLTQMAAQKDKDVCEVFDDKIVIKEKTSFEFNIEKDLFGEVLLQFEGMEYEAVNFTGLDENWTRPSSASVSASLNRGSGSFVALNSSNQYFFGKRDIVINLGCIQTKGVIKISFSHPGIYHFESAELIVEPLKIYQDCVADRKKDAGYDIEIGDNSLSGRIYLQEKAAVYVAVPYSSGWSLTVDGEPTPLKKANVCFMAFEAEPGEHQYILHYTSPGLQAGIIVSAVTLLLTLFLLIRKGKRNHDKV